MPSDQKTVDYILSQISDAGEVTSKKMFGEYCLYCDGKIVGSVNDNLFFVKPSNAGRAFLGEVTEAAPYEGAKPQFLISDDQWDDREFMSAIVKITCAEMPKPKAKKPTKPTI